jgi:hypothetical protein
MVRVRGRGRKVVEEGPGVDAESLRDQVCKLLVDGGTVASDEARDLASADSDRLGEAPDVQGSPAGSALHKASQ